MYRTTARLVLPAAFLFSICGTSRGAQPVGIVLEAGDGAQIERPGAAVPVRAAPGVELFAGDVFLKGNAAVRFAFCPLKRIQTLEPGKGFQLDAANLPPGDLLANQTSVEVCEMPDLDPFADARQGTRRAPRPIDPGDPRVLAVEQSLGATPSTPPLLRRIARSRRLYAAGLLENSAAEYDAIGKQFQGASWIDNLTWSILEESDRKPSTRGVRTIVQQPSDQELPGKTYALVIGVSHYKDPGIPWLDYASADARTFAEYLKSERGGQLRECQEGETGECEFQLITDEEATLARVSEAFDRFIPAHAGAGNRLLIFIAAHGVDPPLEEDLKTKQTILRQPVILTYDSSYSDAKLTGYLMSEIRDHAAKAALTYKSVVVFADTCRAGNIGMIPWSPELGPAIQDQLRKTGVAYFMATSADEDSYESANFGGGHGAFTYAVLNGLTKPDWPADEAVTYGDLKEQVDPLVRRLTNKAQNPTEFIPRLGFTLLPNPDLPTIKLEPYTALSKDATRRRRPRNPRPSAPRNASQDQAPEDDPIAAGRLGDKEPNSAWQVLEKMKQDPTASRDEIEAYGVRLRVALEDRGQQVLIEYLKGDEIQPKAAGFVQCAEDFRLAGVLAGSSGFDSARELFCRARARMFDKRPDDFREAENLLLDSIHLDPKRSYAYNALGIAYLEQGSTPSPAVGSGDYYAMAVRAFQAAIRYAPLWPYPLHNLALALTEQGNYDDAINSYRQAMALEPNYSYLPYNLGLLYQRLNRLSDAEENFKLALDLAEKDRTKGIIVDSDGQKPQESAAENALGTIAAAKRFGSGEAAKLFRAAAADDKTNPAPRHNLALALTRGKATSMEAENLWQGILNQDSRNLAARLALARYYGKQVRLEPGISQYKQLLDIYGDLDVARRELTELLTRAHRPADALAQMTHLANPSKEDAMIYRKIAGEANAQKDDRTRSEALIRAKNR